MAVGAIFIGCVSVPCAIFAPAVIKLFQKSPEVIEIGAFALRFAAVGVIFLALSVPVNMLYQSIRKAGVSSFLSLLRSGLLMMPALIITTSLWGLTGIQISQPIADVLTGLISIPFIIHFIVKTPNEDIEDL